MEEMTFSEGFISLTSEHLKTYLLLKTLRLIELQFPNLPDSLHDFYVYYNNINANKS